MAKRNELSNVQKEIMRKEAVLNMVQNSVDNLEYYFRDATETLESLEENKAEYIEMYTGDDPIEEDYTYRCYERDIAKNKAKLAAVETVQSALLKLI